MNVLLRLPSSVAATVTFPEKRRPPGGTKLRMHSELPCPPSIPGEKCFAEDHLKIRHNIRELPSRHAIPGGYRDTGDAEAMFLRFLNVDVMTHGL